MNSFTFARTRSSNISYAALDGFAVAVILFPTGGVSFSNVDWRQLERIHRLLTIYTFFDDTPASVGQLEDCKEIWPLKGQLHLDGFEYRALTGEYTPKTSGERLAWLRLQPEKPFYPQPYEQLAMVFKRMGHESERREVLIAKQNDLRKNGELSCLARAWNWLLGVFVGHGYRPWKILP
ncbi:MAG: hypothetical protein M0Z48_06175 [Nitrospiraceae bacterium]|nr:hypothetical protein [Nitrospiraceae bacterium]